MSIPIIEQIAEEIKARINEIKTANEFNQNLNAIRPKRVDFRTGWDDLDVLVTQGDEEPDGTLTNMVQQWKQTFICLAFVIDSDTETATIETRLNQVRADIQKKLMEDTTRGGKAIDTILLGSGKFENDEGVGGIAVGFDVQYRVLTNNPYTKG